MKIGKALRDDAATICAIAASNADVGPSVAMEALLCEWTRRNGMAWALAWKAIGVAGAVQSVCPNTYAEAEALLRTGWRP